jgi:hypothetical protein
MIKKEIARRKDQTESSTIDGIITGELNSDSY